MKRRNLRQLPRVSYSEVEEPNLDEYVFCEKCGDFVFEYCSIHGPLLVVPDDKVPVKSPYPPCVPRAALTIPHVFLHIAPSIIPGAGLGVFSTLTLPSGVRFGPYRGAKTQKIDSMYCWQIRDSNNKWSHVIDGSDPNASNWMRYVNCARHWREQNLVAYQYQGQIYYRTIKIIPRFTELMVFYGSEFAAALHVDLRRYNSPAGYAQKYGGVPVLKKQKLNQQTKNEAPSQQPPSKEIQVIGKSSKNVETHNSVIGKVAVVPPNKNNKPVIDQGSKVLKNVNDNEIVKVDVVKENNLKNSKTIEVPKLINSPNVSNNKNKISNNENVTNSLSQTKCSLSNEKRLKTPYQCNFYQKDSPAKSKLTSNLRTHTEVKPYKCDVCQKAFSKKSKLSVHIRSHTGEKPYQCNICMKAFSRRSDLTMHLRTHTGVKPYKCDLCPKAFCSKSDLTKHIRVHTREKPYQCNVCMKAFSQKGYLTRHMRTHTGVKPYKCDVCQKAFCSKSNLKTHMRTHTGQKPYECNICMEAFSRKDTLLMHLRTHTGVKPYKCDVCQKAFSSKSNLTTHMRTHTGQKPYECNICMKAFSQRGDLTTHLRTHTGIKPYQCDHCKQGFWRKKYLIIHIEKHRQT